MFKFNESVVIEKLSSPLHEINKDNSLTRIFNEVSDEDFIKLGVLRILGDEISGRGFLQKSFI
jgi:hypothetical protein